MDKMKKVAVVGAGSLLAFTGAGLAYAGVAPQAESGNPDESGVIEQKDVAFSKTDVVSLDVVEGEFAFTQAEASSNEDLKTALGAAKYLCGARPTGETPAIAAEDWEISVVGAVNNPYAATFSELAATDEVQSVLMGCACAGNPADGKASANAEVTGVSVLTMIGMAQPSEAANTVVFTSADGYEVALPLSYLERRYCPLVFDVNGAPLAESVGGTNQLWLGSTSANYFARDVVAITLEERETPPPAPNSEEARAAYANLPNVGVLLGGGVS